MDLFAKRSRVKIVRNKPELLQSEKDAGRDARRRGELLVKRSATKDNDNDAREDFKHHEKTIRSSDEDKRKAGKRVRDEGEGESNEGDKENSRTPGSSRHANVPSVYWKDEGPLSKKGYIKEYEDTEDEHDEPQRGRGWLRN